IDPSDDPNLIALLKANTPAVAIFGKTWDLHIKQVMNNTLKENLAMIKESVAFLKENDREVVYDAEHFFDGFKENSDYALETLCAAIDAGAEFIVPCDTNGGSLPSEIESIINEVRRRLTEKYHTKPDALPVKIGIHTHNDSGLAVANSIQAVQSGAVMVQGTINGYGESVTRENIAKLKPLSRFVSETANMIPLNSRPFVGKSAFAHKGGIHVSAIMKVSRAYEHMEPELVGNKRRVLVSDLSGKRNIEYKAKELGIELGANGFDSRKIVTEVKRMEQEGYQFDVADASFKILLEKFTDQYRPLFKLKSFRVHIEKDADRPCSAHATIKISVEGQEEITAAEGDGPVSALDNALRKALNKFYPELETMRLIDFKVRVIDGRKGTAARVRVFIESRDQDNVWSTIGVSEDIIEASWHALAESVHYKLSMGKH
ncbi:MAG: citramalate synthase, partial [Deltaproteobacteria bacterium]|nr:citramalate synthase [Deltaproteobacteria bacterium]